MSPLCSVWKGHSTNKIRTILLKLCTFQIRTKYPYSNQKASGNACGHFWHFFPVQILCLGFTLVLSLESLGALSTAVQHCHLGLFLHLSCLHNTVQFCFCTNPVCLSCSHKKSHHDPLKQFFTSWNNIFSASNLLTHKTLPNENSCEIMRDC